LIDKQENIVWLRSQRTTFGKLDPTLGFQTTVFLGLYEGSNYLPSRLRELKNQDSQSFYLLIADNFSNDFDRAQVEAEIKATGIQPGRWIVVRNPVNIGGLGSFQLNLDLIFSEWVTSVHQDDSYLSHHLSTHIKELANASEGVVTVSSDMGSLGPDGNKAAALPRANWFIKTEDSKSIFLANVAMQVVPYPALSIRKSTAELDMVPWATVAFSDSELTLRNLMIGEHKFIQSETVMYRENPNSESHVQGIDVRNHSATIGLLRVFSSSDFSRFVSDLAPKLRAAFAMKLQQSIRVRIGDSAAADLVVAAALEQLAHSWGYTVSHANQQMAEVFLSKNQGYSAEILRGLNHLLGVSESVDHSIPDPIGPIVSSGRSVNHGQKLIQSKGKASHYSRFLRITLSMIGLLPYKLRRRLYTIIVAVYSKLRPGNKWDFNW
jgi:hypothetical protein